MVELDYRINTHAHSAGLRRLSARAAHHHATSGGGAGTGAGPGPGGGGVAAPGGGSGALPSTGGRRVFFSFAAYARTAVTHLRNCHVQIEKGLTDEEFAKVEAAYGFTFPPDLRAILQEGLPVGVGFPNWRHGSPQQLQMRLDIPVAGLLYEVARSKLWWKPWGPRPADARQAVRIALWALRKAPILIPVYSHCFIPASPNLAGNPVFFVHQRDVFISGIDIADFLQRDRFTPHGYDDPTDLPDVMSWSEDGDGAAAAFGSGTGRVMRMGSGRDLLLREKGKESLMAALGRVGLDDGVLGDVRERHEEGGSGASTPTSSRLSDAWRADRMGADEIVGSSAGSSTRSSASGLALERDVESWGRNVDTLVAKRSSEALQRSLENFGRRMSSRSLEHHSSGGSNGGNESNSSSAASTPSKAQAQQQQNRRSNLLRHGAVPPAGVAFGRNASFGRVAHSGSGAGSGSGSGANQGDIMAKFSYFDKHPLPAKTLMHFTVNAPPWAPKAARRIEFWTDLTEKRQQVGTSGPIVAPSGVANVVSNVPEALFSARKVDSDVAANFSHHRSWDCEEQGTILTTPGAAEAGAAAVAGWNDSNGGAACPNGVVAKEALIKFRSTFVPKWVASYLDDISLRLRKGGWQEDDILDIMDTTPCKVQQSSQLRGDQQDIQSHHPQDGRQIQNQNQVHQQKLDNKQSALDALARQAETLSSSLKEAGWSIRDVAEVLGVDFTFGDHRRTTSKLSPELAARLSTFAEYVVNV